MATATCNTWGNARWLCDQHALCRNGWEGDRLVYDAVNNKKFADSADKSIERIQAIQAKRLEKDKDTGLKIYLEGQAVSRARNPKADHHSFALGYMVQRLQLQANDYRMVSGA